MLLLPITASQAETEPCPPGFERYAEYRMFFGRSRPGGGTMSDEEWNGFLAAEVTPRFPDGLTVLAEPGADAVRRTEEIAEAYKRTFDQQSVLRAVEFVCAAF